MYKLQSILLLALIGLSAVAVQGSDELILNEARQLKSDKKKTKKTKKDKSDKKESKSKGKGKGKGKGGELSPTTAPAPTTVPAPTTAPATGKGKGDKKKSKGDKKSKSDKKGKSDKSSDEPTAAPTVNSVVFTLPVCLTVCDESDPGSPAALAAVGDLLDEEVIVTLVSTTVCVPCGSLDDGRRLEEEEEEEIIVEALERTIVYQLVPASPTDPIDAAVVQTSLLTNPAGLTVVAETIGGPGSFLDAAAVVTVDDPVPTPTFAPGRRKLQNVLFDAETKDVMEAREVHEYDAYFATLKQLNIEARMQRNYDALADIMYDEDATNTKHYHEHNRAIVAYSAPTTMDTSDPKNAMYHTNFLYFLDNAIDCSKHSTLIITTEEVAEVYRDLIEKKNEELCSGSDYFIELTIRVDKCYDMESMATFLRETDVNNYDHFLYINCGMVGPYSDLDEHWTETFTSRLSDKVKLTGVSINMSFFPHVQSMSLVTDRVGIDIIKNSGAVYDCGVMNDVAMTEAERWQIIEKYELGMSRAIVEAGYVINSLTGALGKSISIDKESIARIKQEARANKLNDRQADETGSLHWTTNEQDFLMPLGDDIWNTGTIRTVGIETKNSLPSWSDFIFYKASRGILLPEIFEEVQYEDPTIEVIEDIGQVSLPQLADPDRNICEEAKINFREASKLGVIVTGHEHTGTTMLAQLIKSAPGLFGGFECGVSVLEDVMQFYDWLTWSPENDLWGLDEESRDLVMNGDCIAEKYYNLHQYSPLFHYGNNNDSFIVDKAPRYMAQLVQVMDKTPGVPVVVTTKSKEFMYESYRKRGYTEEFIDAQIYNSDHQIEKALKKYPGRIKVVDTTNWFEEPDEVMSGVFDFLGLEWKSEYLNMKALNSKRVPGAIVSKPFFNNAVVTVAKE